PPEVVVARMHVGAERLHLEPAKGYPAELIVEAVESRCRQQQAKQEKLFGNLRLEHDRAGEVEHAVRQHDGAEGHREQRHGGEGNSCGSGIQERAYLKQIIRVGNGEAEIQRESRFQVVGGKRTREKNTSQTIVAIAEPAQQVRPFGPQQEQDDRGRDGGTKEELPAVATPLLVERR